MSAVARVAGEAAGSPARLQRTARPPDVSTSSYGRARMTCQPNDVCTGPDGLPGTAARRRRHEDGVERALGLAAAGCTADPAAPSSAPPVSAAAGSIDRSAASSAKSAPASSSAARPRPPPPSRRGCGARTARRARPATPRSAASRLPATRRPRPADARRRRPAESTSRSSDVLAQPCAGLRPAIVSRSGLAVGVGDRLADLAEELLAGGVQRPSTASSSRPASPATVPVARILLDAEHLRVGATACEQRPRTRRGTPRCRRLRRRRRCSAQSPHP